MKTMGVLGGICIFLYGLIFALYGIIYEQSATPVIMGSLICVFGAWFAFGVAKLK